MYCAQASQSYWRRQCNELLFVQEGRTFIEWVAYAKLHSFAYFLCIMLHDRRSVSAMEWLSSTVILLHTRHLCVNLHLTVIYI